MKLFIIGGSGLLGSATARHALSCGHELTLLSRGKASPVTFSGAVSRVQGDVSSLDEDDWFRLLQGHHSMVYALGVDDRTDFKYPALTELRMDHVEHCLKAVRAAKKAGLRSVVVFGSYFTAFDRLCPEFHLAESHPYVQSRREQLSAVFSLASPDFAVTVLEIPYVFGFLPGKLPPIDFLFDLLGKKGSRAFFFGKGGTAAVTDRQVGAAAIGAAERGKGAQAHALGGINLTWADFAGRILQDMGHQKRIIPIPWMLFRLFGRISWLLLRLLGRERGLDLAKFAQFQAFEAFLDPQPAMAALGYGHDDYDAALAAMVEEWKRLRQ